MPIEEAQREAFTTRLESAYRRTRDGNEVRPWAHELVGDYELGQEWAAICSAYSGIEQTVKLLIALDTGKTTSELKTMREDPVQDRCQRRGKAPYRTHRVGFLFSRLEPARREAVEEHYARWRSLHSYIPMTTCQAFLDYVQGDTEDERGAGRGYENWRCCLIQEEMPVTNSADAMFAGPRRDRTSHRRHRHGGADRGFVPHRGPLSQPLREELRSKAHPPRLRARGARGTPTSGPPCHQTLNDPENREDSGKGCGSETEQSKSKWPCEYRSVVCRTTTRQAIRCHFPVKVSHGCIEFSLTH